MKKHYLLLISAITLLCSSCSHYYYAPNTHNVPVFKERNEVRLSASFTASDKAGADIQAAYAPTNHFALIANASIIQPKVDKNSHSGSGHLYEIGAGYFKPFDIRHKDKPLTFVFEIYGVAGLGGYNNYYEDNDRSDYLIRLFYTPKYFSPRNGIHTDFVKAYVQPSISFGHNIVDVSFSTKIGAIHTYNISTTLPDSVIKMISNPYPNHEGKILADDWAILHRDQTSFILEPAVTVRVGWKYVKMQMQYSFNIPTDEFTRELSPYGTWSWGASFNLAPRFYKKAKAPSPPLTY